MLASSKRVYDVLDVTGIVASIAILLPNSYKRFMALTSGSLLAWV
jgi:hypothetical protein